uniref:Reverse transcriptase domain-containing protein n=1 Tax=Tanacetum cinerariifolium TaxID=118510 RepID=A0A6L2K2Q1_TANCI|nr:reverse transcriptase domain-containing protein [Tanacetum cinerariifolium]
MKVIPTHSVVAYEGPSIPTNPSPKKVVKQETEDITDTEQTNFQGSIAHIQPPVVPIPEPDVPKTLPKPNIPYHSRLNDQKLRQKATNQMDKFFQIFQDFHFDISFADALLLMPKFASTIKILLANKDKLFELAKIPLNENCSAMLLKKLLEKLRDPGKFLILCFMRTPAIFTTKILLLKIMKILWEIKVLIVTHYDDDDDEDYTIAITPKESDNSLSMGDKHLDTIPTTKSNEFIKSSVENVVPNPSESEGKYECDVPACEEIYSNPLFDEEIISMKINPHHFNAESDLIESLLNHDSSIISSSSKIDSLFDEFAGELTLLKSIPLGINETNCDPKEETHFIKRLLYDNSSPRPPKEFIFENSETVIESFSPFPIHIEDSDFLMEEIDLSFTPDDPMSPGIEEDDYDSKSDILVLEELLSNDSLSLPENESFHFGIPSSSRPPAKPPDGNTGILNVKMMSDIFEHKVPMPRLMSTLVPNQEKSLELLSHLGHEAFQPSTECPMMIYRKNTPILDIPFFHFYPL